MEASYEKSGMTPFPLAIRPLPVGSPDLLPPERTAE